MQECSQSNHRKVIFGQPHGSCNRNGKRRDPFAVAFDLGILEVKGIAQSLQSNVIRSFER
jgi:hypothetical protein